MGRGNLLEKIALSVFGDNHENEQEVLDEAEMATEGVEQAASSVRRILHQPLARIPASTFGGSRCIHCRGFVPVTPGFVHMCRVADNSF